MQKVSLCEQCAEDKGVTDPTGFALADLLEGSGTESVSQPAAAAQDDEKCELCGFTQSDFKKTGRFGCSQCYQVFHSGLDNLLEAMHRHSEHHGKKPAHFIDTRSSQTKADEALADIAKLNLLLDEAVIVEDYEEAARLRDSIAQLQNKTLEAEPDPNDSANPDF